MNLTLMISLGIIKVGLVDLVDDDIAQVEYITSQKKIEYKTLIVGDVDCIIKEGVKVFFDENKIVGCLKEN